jgi:hypothetical protein
MRRALAFRRAWALALAGAGLVIAGCGSSQSASTQAEAAMWATVAKPAPRAVSVPAGDDWIGAGGLQIAVPRTWMPVRLTTLSSAISAFGLQGASPAADRALLAGLRDPSFVDAGAPDTATGTSRAPGTSAEDTPAGPGQSSSGTSQGGSLGTSHYQANVGGYCTAAHFPPETNPETGLTSLAEGELTHIDADSSQITATTVDRKPALLIYYELSAGSSSITGLQYAIAASATRTCYVTLLTRQPVAYEPLFARMRTAIRVP